MNGDVVGAYGKKPSKKPWIIAGVVVVILVIIVVVVMAIINSGSGDSEIEGDSGIDDGGDVVVVENAETKFNRFSNFVLYGQDIRDEFAGEYDADEQYEIDIISDSWFDAESVVTVKEIVGFYNKVSLLWNNFSNDYEGDKTARSYFGKIDDRVKFLAMYAKNILPDIEKLNEIYIASGNDMDSVRNFIKEYQEMYRKFGSEVSDYYVDYIATFVPLTANYFNRALLVLEFPDDETRRDDALRFMRRVYTFVRGEINTLVKNCFLLNDEGVANE